MNLKVRIKELSGAALIAALLSCSMTMTLLDSFSISFLHWQVAVCCALTSLVCALMLLGKIPALATVICLSGGAAVFVVKSESIIPELKETLISILRLIAGGEGSLNEHALVIMLASCIVLTLISFLLTRLSGGVYPALLLFLFVLLGGWFVEKRMIPAYVVPGLMALAVLYARAYREGSSYLKALPAALIAAVLAVMLLPAGNTTWKPLEEAAKKVQELFDDYFMFTDPRTVYSVSSDGYQPQGEVLGGPATPRHAPVMTVQTNRTLLMRGSVRRTYTGYSWVDNSINSRYLFLDPTRQSLRDSVFDVDLDSALRGALEETEVTVTMLNKGTSTLFVPHRLKSLSVPLDLAAYYNNSGEVFITRSVEYGDTYTLTASIPNADREQMNALVTAAAEKKDADYQEALDSYMNLPSGLEDGVYWLTQEIIAGAETPYEKACAIYDHLMSGAYRYELEMEIPPSGRDFVSYFLLDAKAGYCTYYASAMAVMARMAGLPSRYIEGYLVPARQGGETVVTGENAHAWVEIYFEGVGWMSFDPTPGGQMENENGGHSDSATPEPTETPMPTPRLEDGAGEGDDLNDDQATATPSPSPTPAPDENDAPHDGEATPTPSPEPDGMTTPEPSEEPDGSMPEDDRQDRAWLRILFIIAGILLLLLIAAYLLYRRWKSTDPYAISERLPDDSARLMLWYRAALTLMERGGYVPEGGETPERFASRLVQAGAAHEQLVDLARAVERQQYARSGPDAAVMDLAEQVYERLVIQMTPRARIRWHMHRMLHGVGSIEQIP